MLNEFWILIHSPPDKFWRDKPFTPYWLNSEGVWSQVEARVLAKPDRDQELREEFEKAEEVSW